MKSFVFSKEKGLRKESFKALSSFIDEAKTWDNNAQQDFACWLFTLFDTSDDISPYTRSSFGKGTFKAFT
ncbi:hypothetical protein [Bacillus atrophaeus]|uniref:hypothetical protein n=1 Tax=Bacillus atrophaeus TaxID=1452 RepID=UPI003872D227